MSLPVPTLDDRRFQDIVDEAKRRIARLCPGWTDHNVSDPGVTLLELYAWMTEMLLYRVNQVPDRLYVKFLELVGIELYTAAPARTPLLFSLSAPRDSVVRIPAGTQVSTDRTGHDDPVVFMTEADLDVVPATLEGCVTRSAGSYEDHWDDLRHQLASVTCFRGLTEGDALYLGFLDSLAGNLLRLHVVTGTEGEGANPQRPPYAWEAWDGAQWLPVRVLEDNSLALNSPKEAHITMLLPSRHEPMTLLQQRAHWLRCKLLPPQEGHSRYRQSPELHSLRAESIGGSVDAQHADLAPAELLGVSDGTPGQTFAVRRTPVLPRIPGETVQVVERSGDGHASPEERVQTWTEVTTFAHAGPEDRVFTWSGTTGEIRFGPAVLDRSGQMRQHGAVPPVDARIRTTTYRHGGGTRGNVGPGRLRTPRTAIPFVASVRNLDRAQGGVDAETVENAKIRGPMTLRSADRAVTAADFERLTVEAAHSVARARCVPPAADGPARVLVVPRVDVPPAALQLGDLALSPDLVRVVTAYLDDRRLLTVRVRVDEPSYQGVMVVAEVWAAAGMRPETVRENADRALYRFVNPIVGGPDGAGWPFGMPLVVEAVHFLLQAVVGVARVESVYLFAADLRSGEVSDIPQRRITPAVDTLFMSSSHQVVVRR